MEIDIRGDAKELVNRIRFSSNGDEYPIASVLVRREGAVGVNITDSDYDPLDSDCNIGFVVVEDTEQATNLIKAIEKAIALGWLD